MSCIVVHCSGEGVYLCLSFCSGRIVVENAAALPNGRTPVIQWDIYENINWEKALAGERMVNGYCNRNGLIRKAHLAAVINKKCRKKEHER